ncbi:VOC family protein [Salipiger sp. 1_MG-2023]|uniref:VOC family protein n=1 Tax=Salipiger sp. 1_MG-2023 TaxID=3062665 RepID=UPI0026E2FD47|nr:VOC family protein [Salipiger sp. 1_MG-2023]MDO6588192.1 VOC family protein [Salipiger sp. 1_MG-2023]
MSRRIDHLVFAVRDLDAVVRLYERLGFRVGARNRHPWGTENRLVQFGSSFLEFVAVGDAALIEPHAPGRFSFGAFMQQAIARREGLAMLVLDSDDARADAQRFAAEGIGAFEPFFFERKGQRADGSETHVAFTLAFAAQDSLPEAGFFTCQQHFPAAFWSADLQQHPNGARNVTGVTLGAQDVGATLSFLGRFAGAQAAEGSVPLPGAALTVIEAETQGFAGYRVAVDDLAALIARLEAEGLAFRETQAGVGLSAFGAEIEFVPG